MVRRRKSFILLVLAAFFIVAGLALMVAGAPLLRPATAVLPPSVPTDEVMSLPATSIVAPSPTPEPLIPTPTLEAADFATPTQTTTSVPASTATLEPTSTKTSGSVAMPVSPSPASFIVPPHERFRLGISLPGGASATYNLGVLQAGWVMDWAARSSTALPPGVTYMPTVRMSGGTLRPAAETLTAVARARPGSTWLISNEPDVRWQDNVDPPTYARLYHEAYVAIKAGDPSAIVAAGGIAQPTPLRLRYLDLALETYRIEFGTELPAQAWHIHNYMLREERNSWGVDIPPGIPDDTGVLFSIDDSGNLDVFRSQIYDFRRWMVSRGYGGQPLIVSEFGVPMPEDYGFPPERMAEFLRETWRFFLTAADAELGDPRDGGRLVQQWCWFSMYYEVYPTGNLIDARGQWMPLGLTWISYVSD